MALRVMMRQLKLLFLNIRSCLLLFVLPFLFRVFLPGFNGRAFPAIMMAFALLGIQGIDADSDRGNAGVLHFPVTVRDHRAGLYLYYAAMVLIISALTTIYVRIAGPDRFMADIVIKSLGLGFLLAALMMGLSNWLEPQVARVLTMLLVILVLNFVIIQGTKGTSFLPWISIPSALTIGIGAFALSFILAMIFPREI